MNGHRGRTTIDGSLSPKELILVWLEEAHQYPDITAYASSTLDRRSPLARILDLVSLGAGRPTKSRPLEDLRKDVRRAQGDVLFLHELVLRLNAVAADVAHVEGLRIALVRLQLEALLANPILNARSKERWERSLAADLDLAWRSLRVTAARALDEVRIEAGARIELERRFLDGRPVLFPGTARDWATLTWLANDLAVFVEPLPEAVGRKPRRRATRAADTSSEADRVRGRAHDLAEDARVEAFLRLGDRPKVLELAERRMRAIAATPPGTGHR